MDERPIILVVEDEASRRDFVEDAPDRWRLPPHGLSVGRRSTDLVEKRCG